VILLDTSGLLAALDRGEPDHARVQRAIESHPGPLLVLDVVLAETDFLVLKRLGRKAERAFLDQLVGGVLHRESLRDGDLKRAREIVEWFDDQAVGLTDAALMAVAERLAVPVLTLDRRHFVSFRTRRGKALTLLPQS